MALALSGRFSWELLSESVIPIVALTSAGLAGYLAVASPTLAQLLLVIPAAFWLLANRFVAALLLGFTLPYLQDISGGATGLNVAVSDVLMTLFVAGLFADWMMTRSTPELRALRPLTASVGPYALFLFVLLVAHFGVAEMIKTVQRLELFIFPMVVGAALVKMGKDLWVLRAFVVGASLTASLWIVGIELGNKNPMGQMMASAVLVLVAVKQVRKRLTWLAPVLVAGVLWTQSRGSIVAIGVGLVTIIVAQPGRAKARSILLAIPLAAASYIAFHFLPQDAQERNLSFSASGDSGAAWALKIREAFQVDAWAIIHTNPFTGIGVGQYRAGSVANGTITTDPHQVLLLQAAEGGYGLAAAFLLLILGTAVLVWRLAYRVPLGPVALAVLLATAAHGLVDVYWVRGTPVLGWLLVGMALAQKLRSQASQEALGTPVRGRLAVGVA